MRKEIPILLMALLFLSCSKESLISHRDLDYEYGRSIPHEKIVLGEQLENPYTTENITKALCSLYPTKADRVDVKATNLYVRFLPKNGEELEILQNLTSNLTDHPLDYKIEVEGDWYHDPSIDEDGITWQYAVVAKDFRFPDMEYEIIDECYIAENDPATRADGIDWEAVEREAYRLSGNGEMLAPKTKAPRSQPEGRLTIIDEDYCQGKPVGIAVVRVSCNSFVKFDQAYTDRDGYYKMNKFYSSNLRYRIIFKNEKGFNIGFNTVLFPASVSTLGKSSPEGVSMTVTKDSDTKLFRRSVVNNAAYDYISRCNSSDLDITAPPKDLRIWIFHSLSVSSAVMMHHGTVLEGTMLSRFLGEYSNVVKFFLPDITIGASGAGTFSRLYSTTCHELAHASHFSEVGMDYWNQYIYYIVESYLKTGQCYGEGTNGRAGYCQIGEMWAYYLESKIFKDRCGGTFPTFGTSYWFHPQIFRYLDERGLSASDIFSVLEEDVNTLDKLKSVLLRAFPDKRTVIEQVFSRYKSYE